MKTKNKTSKEHVSKPDGKPLVMRGFYFKTSTGFENYWCNGIYLMIQDISDEYLDIKPYARILSEKSINSQQFFDTLKENNELIEITKDEFEVNLNRAFEIVRENLA